MILPFLAFACQKGGDLVTSTGVEVTQVVKGEGSAPIKDSIVVIQLKLTSDNGEVLTESSPMRPLAMMYDPTLEAGDIQEVLKLLHVGDSVSFSVTAKNLFEKTYRQAIPPTLDSTSVINCQVKFQDQMSKEGYQKYMTELRQQAMLLEEAKMADQLAVDVDSIDAYLAEKGIEAITTESGLRYVITEEGSGPTAEPGDNVKVVYVGKLMDGTIFDTSIKDLAQQEGLYDERREPYEPLSFPIGRGQVIKGWDEGLGYIKEGGKATFYIPSSLAYGSRQAGPKVPPYSILVFDVELTEVNPAE